MISLDCFACKSKITAPDQAAGQSGKCPKCGALLLFPSGTVDIEASPPEVAKSETRLPKLKRKKIPKKESSWLPFYMACGALGLVVICAVALWIAISFYMENRRTREIQEQELAELQRKRDVQEKQYSFLTAQQKLDEANLKFRQQKQERDRAALEELDRQNEELKRKREKALQDAAKEVKERSDEQAKGAKEKEKAIEDEKRRELLRKKQMDMIEEDHKTILAYGKIHIKGTVKDMLWSPPLRAVSLKDKENGDIFAAREGLLYRLQGVVGENRKPVSYYFFVINREVLRWQPAKSNSAVTICKIIGDLEVP